MSLHTLTFAEKLAKLKFKRSILEEGNLAQSNSTSNLYLVSDRNSAIIREKEPQIAFALEQAYKFDNNIYAVYFRHFENNLPSIPQIYIYDYSEFSELTSTQENKLAQIHRNLWNTGFVPFIYVFTATDIIIINSSKQPKDNKDTILFTPFEILKDISNVFAAKDVAEKEKYEKFEEFSADRFDSGYFFENSAYKNDVTLSNTAYEKLLSLLEKTKNSFIKRVSLLPNNPTANAKFVKKFLLMCILVKYLEDRKDETGNTVFPQANDVRKYTNGDIQKITYTQNFFDRILTGASSFIDIVSNGEACVKLFRYLSKHFLGTVFSLKEEDEKDEEEWRNEIALKNADPKQLELFKTFLEGKTEENQPINIWKLYSFQYLPVELISNIYENFLERNEEGKRQTGVVYTPPFLVRLLIDQSMPLKKYLQLRNKNEKGKVEYFKVLDPSCGSGVFLVAAYCRLVQWWRIQNNWEQPKLAILKEIFSKSIFGVDINQEAVNVAIFSLTIALLDMLSPIVIWDNLTFEEDKTTDNEENEKEENKPLFKLHPYDFFKLTDEKSTIFATLKLPTHFDLVIGNPPFATFKDLGKDAVFAKKIDAVNQKNSNRPKLPDNQVALLFAEESIKLCKPEGLLCMILPSSPFLYNNKSDGFRKYFLETYEVAQILDFTQIESLFKNKNIASSDGAQVSTLALFAKNIKPSEKSILHLVFKRVKSIEEKMYFELDKYDFHWVSKSMAKNSPIIWKCNYMGGGRIFYIIDRLSGIKTLKSILDENKVHLYWGEGFMRGGKEANAPFLTDKPAILADNFTSNSFEEIDSLPNKNFTRPRKEILYKKPLLLIKEVVEKETNKIPVKLIDKNMGFDSRIVGIHSKTEQGFKLLNKIDYNLNKFNSVYAFFIMCISGQYGIGKDTAILAGDIYKLPFPINDEDLEVYNIERVIIEDMLNYTTKFRSNGSKSEAVQPIKEEDRETIMNNFSKWFLSVMNSVYKDIKTYKTLFIGDFVCFIVYKGEKLPEIDIKSLEKAEVYLNNLLIQKNISKTIQMTKIITIFDKNVTYLIKPNQLRYWLPSIAIRDADEIFAYLMKNDI